MYVCVRECVYVCVRVWAPFHVTHSCELDAIMQAPIRVTQVSFAKEPYKIGLFYRALLQKRPITGSNSRD